MRLNLVAFSAFLLAFASSTALASAPDDTSPAGVHASSDPARGGSVRKGSGGSRRGSATSTRKAPPNGGTQHAPAPRNPPAGTIQQAPGQGQPAGQGQAPAQGAVQQGPVQQGPIQQGRVVQPAAGQAGAPGQAKGIGTIDRSTNAPGINTIQGNPAQNAMMGRVPTQGALNHPSAGGFQTASFNSGPRQTISGSSQAFVNRTSPPVSVHQTMAYSGRVNSISAVRTPAALSRTHVAVPRSYAYHHSAVAHRYYSHRAWVNRHHWRPWNHRPWYRPAWYHRPWYARPAYHHAWWRPHPVWVHGVFIYGPWPHHSRYVYIEGRPEPAPDAVIPERKVDRTGQLSVGLRGGSYLGNYDSSYAYPVGYGDFGMGLAARYRVADALGLEFSWLYHDQKWTEETERITQPLSATVQVFGFPWTKVNPYFLAGVTLTARNYHDTFYNGFDSVSVSKKDALFGPTGGLGLELGVGQNASINLEGRLTGYLNVPAADPTVPMAGQLNAGFNLYF